MLFSLRRLQRLRRLRPVRPVRPVRYLVSGYELKLLKGI